MAIELLQQKEWLEERYLPGEMSLSEIATEAGCGIATVHRMVRRHNIPYRSGNPTRKQTTYGRVTPREKEVVQCIASGLTGKEIAAELCVSIRTVQRHLANVYQRHGLQNQVELVVAGWHFGWIDLDTGWQAIDLRSRKVREMDGGL